MRSLGLRAPAAESALLVAELAFPGLAGALLLEARGDYFTGVSHGTVTILVVAREAERKRAGRALLGATRRDRR